jgi:flagellar protein FliO/FliZ
MGELLEFNLVSTGVKTMAMLFVVLALLILTLYLFKRFTNYQGNPNGEISIKSLSTLSLSPKDKLQVVQIEDQRIVIGVSPGGINYITKINQVSQENKDSRIEKHEDNS